MAEQPTPRYRWRKTWDDRKNDFVCVVEGKNVCRIYLHHTGNWLWFMNATWLPGRTGQIEGNRPRAAAVVAEDAYDEAVAASLSKETK